MFEKAKFEKRGFMEYRRKLDERIFETVNFENSNSCVFVDVSSILTVEEDLHHVMGTIATFNKEGSNLKVAIVPLDIEVDDELIERASIMITSSNRKINQNDTNKLLEKIGGNFTSCSRKYFNGIIKFEHTDIKDLYAVVLDMATFEMYKHIAKETERSIHMLSSDTLFTSELIFDHSNDGSRYMDIHTPIIDYANLCFHEDTKWTYIESTLNDAEDTLLQLIINEKLYISDVDEVLAGIGTAYGLGLLINKYRDSSLETSNITMLEHFLRNVYTLVEVDKHLILDHVDEAVVLYAAFCKLNTCIHGVRSNLTLLQNLVNKKRFKKEEVNE